MPSLGLDKYVVWQAFERLAECETAQSEPRHTVTPLQHRLPRCQPPITAVQPTTTVVGTALVNASSS